MLLLCRSYIMQRLLLLSCLCLLILLNLQLLRNLVTADIAAASASTLCNPLKCTNLGDVPYPFEDSVPCSAPSDSFRLSFCTSTSAIAYWNAFSQALGSDGLSTTVTGVFQLAGDLTFINLTWNMHFLADHGAFGPYPLLAVEVDTYIPKSINLTSFANGSLLLSNYNHILLLNCSSLPSSPPAMHINSTICHRYQEQYIDVLKEYTPCAEIEVPTQELSLHHTLERFGCTHFQFLVAANDSTAISTWLPGHIQLFYTYGYAKCAACYMSGGTCVFDKAGTGSFKECACRNGTYADTDCHRNINRNSCKGFNCNAHARIAIGVTATVVGMVIASMLGFWVFNRKSRYSTKSFTSSSSDHLLTQRAYMLSRKFGRVATKEFSFEILSKATKSFADENMIGDGGFGAVYFGILRDGRKIAVKRLYHDNFNRMDHFYNEIKILSNLSHSNLVKLYGFCCQDSKDLLLVFEYASNGTVSDQLHDATKPAMPWKTRLNIARETAEALSYLHNSVNPPIYHRDVKTTNILLDDDLHAKLADFGLSRLVPLQATHVSTAPQGTPGYLDPDYHQCYQLTDKSDVYSFGVVLVELVSAKLAVDMSRDRREINLSNLALMKIGCGQWEDLVDPRLEMRKHPYVELMVKRVVELAFMCLHAEKDSRPTMKYIAETLASMCNEFEYGNGDDVEWTYVPLHQEMKQAN